MKKPKPKPIPLPTLIANLRRWELSTTNWWNQMQAEGLNWKILRGILDNYGTDHPVLYNGRSYKAIKIKARGNLPELRVTTWDGTAKQLADLIERKVRRDEEDGPVPGMSLTCLDGEEG